MTHALLLPLLFLAATDRLIDDPAILASFSALLKDAGYGWFNTERAAFVVAGDDGQYRCIVWKPSRTYRQQTFNGVIPERTIAIVHTHPRLFPFPSAGDQETAARLSLPIFVLTPRNIAMATPKGRKVWIVQEREWSIDVAGQSAGSPPAPH